MGHLGSGISAKVADTEGAPMGLGRQFFGADAARRSFEAKVPVLAGDAIEGASLVKDGQVDLAPLAWRRVRHAATLAHPVGHTVCGKRVVIPTDQRALGRTRQVDQSPLVNGPQSAQAKLPFPKPAGVDAQGTFNAVLRTWCFGRQAKLVADLAVGP
jgi:hypothetical protein